MSPNWSDSQVIFLPNSEATYNLGLSLGKTLTAGTVILLEGDLGAGKTTLVQGIAKGLGIKDFILSPTFTLVNEYLEGKLPLYHLDLYRLNPKEVEQMFLEIYWEGDELPLGITAIEWPERLTYKPEHYLSIKLLHRGDGREAHFVKVMSIAPTPLSKGG
jgi:tRNA threonylcarbamoyladenosine biosynthesis protein TsaE